MRYLGNFIRDNDSKRDWLQYHRAIWENDICMTRKTGVKYTQEIHTAVAQAIQLEWIFLQHVKKHGIRVCGSGEDYSGNLFALPILRKIKISPIHCRNLKYIFVKKSRSGTIKPGELNH